MESDGDEEARRISTAGSIDYVAPTPESVPIIPALPWSLARRLKIQLQWRGPREGDHMPGIPTGQVAARGA